MGKKRRKADDIETSSVESAYTPAAASEIPGPGPRGGYDDDYDQEPPMPRVRGGRRSYVAEGAENEGVVPAPGPAPGASDIPGPGPGPSPTRTRGRGGNSRRRNDGPADGYRSEFVDEGYGAGDAPRRDAARRTTSREPAPRDQSRDQSRDYGRNAVPPQERPGGRGNGYGRGRYSETLDSAGDNDFDFVDDYGDEVDGDNPYTNAPRGQRSGGGDQVRGDQARGDQDRGGQRGRGNNGPQRQQPNRIPAPGPGPAPSVGQGGRSQGGRGQVGRPAQRQVGRPTMGGGRQQGRYAPAGRGPNPGPAPRGGGMRRPDAGRGGGYRNQGTVNRASDPYLNDQDRYDDASVELHEEMGMLEMHPNGYGFLRKTANNYSRERTDPFVPGTMIERFGLREGMMIRGMIRPGRGQTGPRVKEIIDVDGLDPEACLDIRPFDSLTPINPEEWYRLEIGPKPLTNRVIDLLAPMGKGQRALIVAPPRSGKTILLQHISQGIAANYPDTKLIVLLVDERPEEVTDMRRNVIGEVVASSLDEEIESHVRLSQLVIERCKRLAEMGKDVFLLMDSITRLARAFNKWVGDSGRTMSGGVDIKAMDIPKKLFATARAFEEGGSVTIAGTALIDTDSRMDELIFQEFKGTGNMELVLDRKLAERRVWPAIDISKSGTRREELLLPEQTLTAVTALRRTLTQMNPIEAMEQLSKQLGRFDSNAEFIHLISGKMTND